MIRFLPAALQLLILLLPFKTAAQIVADSLDCFYTLPPNTGISMQVAWTSAKHKEFAAMIPITVNLNPQTDSIPELLAQLVTNVGEGRLLFFRGDGPVGVPPDTLYFPFFHYFMTPVAGDVDLDGIPEIVLNGSDRYIRVFRHYTPGANPPMEHWITSDLQVRNIGFRPLLADMNGDGVPEVVAGDEVFIFDFSDPVAPKLRKVLDANGYFGANQIYSDQYLSAPAIADILTPADCGGDPDCNGLEIVAGPVIYSVDIDTTDGDGFQIKVVRDLNAQVLPDRYGDGYTAVADLNLDGIPDIAVDGIKNPNTPSRELGVYVWNKNGFLKFMPRPEPVTSNLNINTGFLTIANVFDDRKRGLARDFPEILSSGNDYLVCQNLHGTSFSNYSAWWYLPVAATHWGSDATAFDFNGDGYAEIVWGDGRNLRILYGGHLPFPPGVDPERNWASIPNINYGFENYPVVADVDNDGQTEIAVLVRDSFINSFDDTGGAFRIVESAGLPWPPSRPIWNQCTYNIVNVNDDASIPAQPQKQWLEYPNPGSDFRPLNMHLGQLPLLGPNFLPVFPLPDASVSVDSVGCAPNSFKIYLQLCNTGDAKLPPGTSVQFYLDNPANSAAAKYGPPLIVPFNLPVDTCLTWTAVLTMPPNGTLWGVINDNGTKPAPFDLATDFPSTNRPECDYTNNLFSTVVDFSSPMLDLGADQAVCPQTAVSLDAGAGFSTYQWQDGATASTYQAQGPGTYWVQAWDFCGNMFVDSITLTPIQTQPFDLGPDVQLCAGDSLQLNFSGFDQLEWATSSGMLCNNCPSLTLQPTGTQTLWATATSGVCTLRDTLIIQVNAVPELSAQVTATSCGADNGAIDLQIDQGTPPYQIGWSGGLGGTQPSNLPADQYTVTVSDAAACSTVATYDIAGSSGPEVEDAQLIPVACFGENTGQIAVQLNGGVAPYQFNWSTGLGGALLPDLPAGDYALTVTDANGCSTTAGFTVTEPPALFLQAQVDSTDCSSTTASIAVDGQGGTGPYAYAWSSGQQVSTLNDVLPGTYTVTVSDAQGCTLAQTFVVQSGGAPFFTGNQLTPVACFGENTGQIAVQTDGGVAPYQFTWSTGAGGALLPDLPAGDYALTVTDANGCSTTAGFTVTEPPPLALSILPDAVPCAGMTGGLAAIVQGGTPGYAFAWDAGFSDQHPTGLPAGQYAVTVTDSSGCSISTDFLLPEPPPLNVQGTISPVLCTQPGSISVDIQGGTAPYAYAWNTGHIEPVLDGLTAGAFTVTVSDANGCSSAQVFTLVAPAVPLVSDTVLTPVRCFGESSGEIQIALESGTPPYQIQWSNGSMGTSVSGLSAGTYTATVTDSGACSFTVTLNLTQPEVLEASALTIADTCQRQTGAIDLSVTGGVLPYGLLWSDGQTTDDRQSLAAGNWAFTLTDGHGCVFSQTVAVPAVEIQPVFSLSADTVTCTRPLAGLEVVLAPGSWIFQWETPDGNLLNGAQQNVGLAGTYQVTVTNAEGCSVAQSINVVADTVAPQANIATAGIVYIPCDQAPVLLVGSSTSVGPDIETRWFLQSNGQNNWDTLATSIVANIPGIYLFQVLDNGNGCKTTDTVELQLLPGIDALALEVDSVSCFGLRDAEIRVDSVTGGVPPYSYSIDQQPFGANTVFPGLGAGTYAIAVQDVEGCTFETNVILAQPDSFYVTLDASGTTLSEGQSLLLKAQVLPPGFAWANIEWFPPGLFANPLLLTQLVKPAETTQFEIVVSDQQGCTAAAGVLVQVEQTGVYLPNAIYSGRPDNGVFTVFAGADVEMVHLLRIFDRWGELLFERRDFSPNDPAQGWDGTFRGDVVAPGVYVYYLVIRLANGNELELRGDVTVFR